MSSTWPNSCYEEWMLCMKLKIFILVFFWVLDVIIAIFQSRLGRQFCLRKKRFFSNSLSRRVLFYPFWLISSASYQVLLYILVKKKQSTYNFVCPLLNTYLFRRTVRVNHLVLFAAKTNDKLQISRKIILRRLTKKRFYMHWMPLGINASICWCKAEQY